MAGAAVSADRRTRTNGGVQAGCAAGSGGKTEKNAFLTAPTLAPQTVLRLSLSMARVSGHEATEAHRPGPAVCHGTVSAAESATGAALRPPEKRGGVSP